MVAVPATTAAADRTDGTVASAQLRHAIDQLTAVPDERDYRVTYADIVSSAVSIVLRCISIVINGRLAYAFYEAAAQAGQDQQQQTERFGYFVWTVACLTVPMVVTACLQVAFHCEDVSVRRSAPQSGPRVLCCVVCVPIVLRYWHSFSYAVASKRAQRRGDRTAQIGYYERLIHHDSDVALIRIFECYLEVAPQKCLQIYIMLRSASAADVTVLQMLSIGSALVSMAWCIAAYHRAIRWSQVDKLKSTWCGTLCQWLGHFLIAVSRVLAIALLATGAGVAWTLVACTAHALLMAGWCVCCDRSPFCARTVVHSGAFALVLGAVFVFTYVLPRPRRRTARRFAAFYGLCGAENVAAVAVFVWRWRVLADSSGGGRGWLTDGWMVWGLGGMAVVPFALGVGCLVLYYVRFHPNVVVRRRQQEQQQQQQHDVVVIAAPVAEMMTSGGS